jgi:glycolate dehydrogenase FAD-linked subunit
VRVRQLLLRLESELGSARVLHGEERLHAYARDESDVPAHYPDGAVLCTTRDEVALVLRLAAEHKVAVTPRGAGTGMTGGAIPATGGIVLSTEKMGAIVEIDADDLVAVVEPGVILGELQEKVEAQGLFYPPDPASLAMCSIGGNVAENAGGPRAFKYGVTREYVIGLEVALMGGELLRMGRRTAKGVTGYDLVGAFVGSEGTFGVTTEITVKLLPRPTGVATMLAVFDSIAAAGDGVTAILRRGFRPRALELMDRLAIDHVRPKAQYRFPPGAGAVAIIELDGDMEGLEAAVLRCAAACEEKGAIDVLVAKDDAERRRLWQARRICSPSLREAHRAKVAEDIAVPRGAIPEVLRRIEKIAQKYELPVATFGHAGDGNLHVNFLVDEDRHAAPVARRILGARETLFRETVALRGTLSGEHGIGLTKQRFMPLEQSEALIGWQKKLKRLWDPDNLMNPGKIFP